jgi:hypothetical protein
MSGSPPPPATPAALGRRLRLRREPPSDYGKNRRPITAKPAVGLRQNRPSDYGKTGRRITARPASDYGKKAASGCGAGYQTVA